MLEVATFEKYRHYEAKNQKDRCPWGPSARRYNIDGYALTTVEPKAYAIVARENLRLAPENIPQLALGDFITFKP